MLTIANRALSVVLTILLTTFVIACGGGSGGGGGGPAFDQILRPLRTVALGSSVDDVKAAQGNPDSEDSGFLSYNIGVDGGFYILEYSFVGGALVDINIDAFLESADQAQDVYNRLVNDFTGTHGAPAFQETDEALFLSGGEEVDIARVDRTAIQGNGGVSVGRSR